MQPWETQDCGYCGKKTAVAEPTCPLTDISLSILITRAINTRHTVASTEIPK